MNIAPALLVANGKGRIRAHPELGMLAARGDVICQPDAGALIPLPAESELFYLPGRRALGWDAGRGKVVEAEGLAVAAFAAPAYTLSAHPAYREEDGAPLLPLFAYGAVGYWQGRYWICARKVDKDKRQQFAGIKPERIERGCRRLLAEYPENRLVGHIINNCVRRYDCPAARNFALGRYEAPLPTSRACNARCLGCISLQGEASPIKVTPQCRLGFTPGASEIVEVMKIHAAREKACPVYSFGQGCEGDPLWNAELLAGAIAKFRHGNGHGTVNCNTNASRPEAVQMLAKAGLTSLRVSLNSARPNVYRAYYRPVDYDFADVAESIKVARKMGVFVSLNLLYFPGVTDMAPELAALSALCRQGVAMIQWRNLNIDPQWYLAELRKKLGDDFASGKSMGLKVFMERLQAACPWLRYGYFNPWLGDKAEIAAPRACRHLTNNSLI